MNYRIWEIQYAGSPKTLWSQVEPTPTQLEIAARLGIRASPDDTFAVVASTILEEVGDAIGCPPPSRVGPSKGTRRRIGDRCWCLQVVHGLHLSRSKR